MIPELHIFTNEDLEPWAVFYFGTDDYGLTTKKAISEYEAICDLGFFGESEFPWTASEPRLFYICKSLYEDGSEQPDDGYCWVKCDADNPNAVACYGVTFE